MTQPITEDMLPTVAESDKQFEEATKEEIPAETKLQTIETAYKREASSFIVPVEYQHMKLMAIDFINSRALPSGFSNSQQVLVAFQAGKEMGMQPFESIQSLYFVNGSLNIWGKATVRRLREHGWNIQYTDETPESVTATISKGKESYTDTYKYSDAEKSGYTKDKYGKIKISWAEGMNRRLKLRYGVLSLLIKSYVPEVLGSATNIVEVQEDAVIEANKNEAISNSIDEYAVKIGEAKTEEELQTIWQSLPATARKELTELVKEKKASLQ